MDKRQEKAKACRYKKAIIDHLNYSDIEEDISELSEIADNVVYTWDDENLLEALDGDEEQVWELKILMSDLSNDCGNLYEALQDFGVSEHFDDFFVALAMHDRPPQYRMLRWDSYELNYYDLVGNYEEKLAEDESIKRLKRLTKDELLLTAGDCFRVVLAYLDIREKINSLGTAIDIIRDENKAILDAVKNIEALYEEAEKVHFRPYDNSTVAFDNTLRLIPEKIWIE